MSKRSSRRDSTYEICKWLLSNNWSTDIKCFSISEQVWPFPAITFSKKISSDGLEAQMSRLSQKHAGEFYAQAKHASSSLISINSMSRLFAILPPRFSVQNLEKIFSTTTDGYAYQTGKFRVFFLNLTVVLLLVISP